MKLAFRVLLFLGWGLIPAPASSAPPSSNEYHIVLPRHAIAAGERVALRLVPPAPAGVRVLWGIHSGSMGIGLQPHATYIAPYVIPAGTPPARVVAGLTGPGIKTTVEAEIELMPGSLQGSEDCLGPDQSFSTVTAIWDFGDPSFSRAGELIHRVDPDYPRSAFSRGIKDTITVIALVCRSGRVLDAYVPTSYADLELTQPADRDPKLVEAALQAVRQYLFSPSTGAGWVITAVPFR